MADSLRFIVRRSFTLSGRGTVALGYIETGAVQVGDELVLLHDDERRTVTCEGIGGGVRVRDWNLSDPAPILLMLPELQPEQLAPGDVIVSAARF